MSNEKQTKQTEAPQLMTLTMEQFERLLGNRGDSDEFLKKQAQYQAEANKKALRPENEQHPGISVYRPNGRKNLELKCKTFWVGYPLDVDTLTEDEVRLINEIDRVGEYTFTKSDGSASKISVTGERDANGNWTRMLFHFPCQGDDRYSLPSMKSILTEVRERQNAAA